MSARSSAIMLVEIEIPRRKNYLTPESLRNHGERRKMVEGEA